MTALGLSAPQYVDVHQHVVPPAYRDALRREGIINPIQGVDYPAWSLDETLEMMDRRGIAAAIVSITDPGVSFVEGDAARTLARAMNEFMADLVRERPHRFGAFGVLPLPDVDAALEELLYALDVLHVDGIGLMSNYRGTYPGDPALEPVLAELDRRAVPTFVHPATPPSDGRPDFGLPVSLYEFTFDTTRMVANLLYSRTLDRYPDLPIILSHAGGTVPYLASRLTYGPTINAGLNDRAPHDLVASLRRLYYDTAMSASPYALPSLRALADPSHILLGTDFPFMPEQTTAETLEGLIAYGGLGDTELDDIRRGNALALFPRLRDAQPALA
jgi:predicted TIM-barrel fold metal-dependent hydrolase